MIKQRRGKIQCKESETTTELRCKIDQLDLLAELGPPSAARIAAKTDAVRDLTSFVYIKLNDLKQKSRYKWASKEDENTSFFHGIINGRRIRSRINGISILGDWVTDPMATNVCLAELVRGLFPCVRSQVRVFPWRFPPVDE
nr:cytochrome P450 [Tanacetum cinerariifolium]